MFALAAVGKLADRQGSRDAMIAFGVPTPLAPVIAVAVPLAELAIALALVPAATAWYGAIGALVLLLAFAAGIAWALARGRKPDCHCFGQIHSSPAGPGTLLRNGALAAIAGFIVVSGPENVGYSTTSGVGDLTAGETAALVVAVAALALIAAQSWFLWQVLRQNGNLLLRIEAVERTLGLSPDLQLAHSHQPAGMPIGDPALEFSLPDHEGIEVSLETLRLRGVPVLLAFTDPDCGPCNSLLPEVARWQSEFAKEFTTMVISGGSVEANRDKAAQYGLNPILIQPDRSVSDAYGCAGTPCAVLVSADGVILSAPAGGPGAIRELVERASGNMSVPVVQPARAANGHSHTQPLRGLPVGDAAPPVVLPGLDGATLDVASLRGRQLAVFFWNPGCGYCRRILPDIKAWESEARDRIDAVFVSRGAAADNRAMGLRSKVLIDEGFTAGRAFGATGTPSAVLVDADGNIASSLAAGAPSVLALVRSALSDS